MTDARRRAAATARVLVLAALSFLLLVPGAARAADDDAPTIQAPAAIVVELSTGDVVFGRKQDQQRGIASTTKLMTALVALEHERDLTKRFRVPAYAASAGESLANLHAGDRMTMEDLLGGMLLPSGNDAAAAIARSVGGSVSAFVGLMNDRARAIGLDARFRNPIGLDAPGHHASAADLVKITLLLRRFPAFRAIVDRKTMTLRSATPAITVENRNTLVQEYPWVDGVKTGHTRASGYSLVGSGRRRGISVVSVVLGDPTEAARDSDSIALLRYATDQYRRTTALKRGTVVGRPALRYRDEDVAVVAASSVVRTARRDEQLTTRVLGVPKDVEGPLRRGARLGTIEVLQRGRVVARIPAVTATEVRAATFWQRLDDGLERGWVRFLIAVAVVCLLVLAFLVRRSRRTHRVR
ncbi:D-alanyl-D-alanine carboxypeptidase family protein [Patulibacter sp. NPDC049589]|uniref:D-alanyl-D-alanine carboxypeptidase family protein n=1 Tax=Patulibacter sp. NPDC049589 TaxID=3154731 RepID=UPI0034243BD9